ncbi:MAG: 7-carboxy-7-deazaguanine synthase, partial [Glaciecola sp.]
MAEEEVSSDVIFVKSADSPTYFSTQSEALLPLLQRQGYTAKHIVITGGEPCMFDLKEFTILAHSMGYSTQIETSGTYEVLCHSDTWVTV